MSNLDYPTEKIGTCHVCGCKQPKDDMNLCINNHIVCDDCKNPLDTDYCIDCDPIIECSKCENRVHINQCEKIHDKYICVTCRKIEAKND